MNLTYIGSELRRFGHGKLPPIAITVVMLLPLIFGGLFVWSYFDPIGRINKLPVALVESDRGADVSVPGQPTQHVDAGRQVVDKLLRAKPLDFHEVSAEEARDGVANGKYYFALEVPEDFSQSVTSSAGDRPRAAIINAAFNNENGFIGTMLGTQATNQVISVVDAELGHQVTQKLLVGFSQIGPKLDEASNGANRLHDGAGRAQDGSSQLADGSGRLHDGASQAQDGSQQLANGAERLDNGLAQAQSGASQLADGLAQLQAGTDRLGNGAGQVSGGVDQLVGSADQASGAQANLIAPLVNLSAQLKALPVPGAADLAAQADGVANQLSTQGVGPNSELMGKLHQLRDGAAQIQHQLSDPGAEYRGGVDRAVQGSQQLRGGIDQLKDGSSQLVVGARRLADGNSRLAQGSEQLTVGATTLRDGLVQLDDGSGKLALGLANGAKAVPRQTDDQTSAMADALSTPVQQRLTEQRVTTFGVGLAPFFISLGLFMGGTVMFMLLRPLPRRVLDSGAFPLRVAIAAWLPPAIVGFCQATIMWLVLNFVIGLHPAHPVWLLASMWGVSATFVAVTQSINAAVGPTAGRVACLLLMALQLVSSGGLYPPETQPRFIQAIHPFMPMTYSVNLFRQQIIGTNVGVDPRLHVAILMLMLVAAVSIAITCLSSWGHRIIRLDDLHPEVAV